MAVLNPLLYNRLKAVFKHVKVEHPGEKQTRRKTIDLETGRRRTVVVDPGEYYKVCCPFCNDTRFRLYINHAYAREDEYGKPQTFLATCFNAGCPLANASGASTGGREIYERLEEMLTGKDLMSFRQANILPGKEVDLAQVRSTWPGKVTRLDRLPSDHPAVSYIRDDRGFDPEHIGRYFNVHYCYESTRFLCNGRLIIPLYHKKRMIGWQARYVGELDWKKVNVPKYYTAPGTPKSKILYNLGNAERYSTGLVVEGVMDVWSAGPMAVATLGSRMSSVQQSLFVRAFKDYSGVLVYDPDAIETEASKLTAEYLNKSIAGGFCRCRLAEGTDPGSLAEEVLRSIIESQSSLQGVSVSWERR